MKKTSMGTEDLNNTINQLDLSSMEYSTQQKDNAYLLKCTWNIL